MPTGCTCCAWWQFLTMKKRLVWCVGHCALCCGGKYIYSSTLLTYNFEVYLLYLFSISILCYFILFTSGTIVLFTLHLFDSCTVQIQNLHMKTHDKLMKYSALLNIKPLWLWLLTSFVGAPCQVPDVCELLAALPKSDILLKKQMFEKSPKKMNAVWQNFLFVIFSTPHLKEKLSCN